MAITTRGFTPADLAACSAIEAATIPNNQYLKDVVGHYTTTRGELTLGLVDGQIAGIGKLTVLFDGSAWLELLRVHPDYQRRGVAAQIYVRYMEQIAQLGCPAVAMYTGLKNVPSAALATKNGLTRGQEYHGMSLELAGVQAPQSGHQLELVDCPRQVEQLLEPLRAQAGGRLNINHTFYAMNPGTYSGFASSGWVYANEACTLVMGARFQPKKALYIAALAGDMQQGLDYAIARAKALGVGKINVHFPLGDGQAEAFYAANGFVADPSDDVVMERFY